MEIPKFTLIRCHQPTDIVSNIDAYKFTSTVFFQGTEDYKAGVTIGNTGFHNGLRLQDPNETVEQERALPFDSNVDWIRKLQFLGEFIATLQLFLDGNKVILEPNQIFF